MHLRPAARGDLPVKKRAQFDLAATKLARGTTLIEASAGTGKTYTITGLFIRLLLEARLSVDAILVTTFTEAATAELRERIRRRLSEAEKAFESSFADHDAFLAALLAKHAAAEALPLIRAALRDFDRAAISTIHGFCQRMLREHAFESGLLFDTELITNQRPLLEAVVEDFWRRQFYECEPVITALAGGAGWTTSTFMKLLEAAARHPFLRVRPEVAAEQFEKDRRALCACHSALRELWQADEAAIRECICGGEKWARGSYSIGQPEKAKALLDQVALALAGGIAAPAAFEALTKFTKSQLQGACLKGCDPPAHDFFALCEEYAALATGLPRAFEAHFISAATEELRRQKTLRNVLSFDDLLTQLFRALEANPPFAEQLARRYPAALIDEFQDTDPMQAAIFQRIYRGGETWLYLIGDPKQAIYAFRGADVFSYLEVATRAKPQFTLLTNRRSETPLVAAVNHLFSRCRDPFLLEKIQFESASAAGQRDRTPLLVDGKAGAALEIWAWNEADPIRLGEAKRVAPRVTAAEIARLLSSSATIAADRVRPSDIAVLVAQNQQAPPMQEALAELGIASRLITDASVFETREAAELHIVLTAIAEPAREPALRAALATEILGANAAELDRLATDEHAWEERLARFQEYRDRWVSAGFIAMFRHVLQAEQLRTRLLAHRDGERRLTNLLQLGELAHTAAIARRLGVRALVKWLGDRRAEPSASNDEMKLRLERDDDAVAVITMHRCKGLEYPIVFCPFVWGRARGKDHRLTFFHDTTRPGRPLTLDLLREDMTKAAFEFEQLAEEVRVLYVALTRAKHRCYVLWARFNQCHVSAAARLFHLPPNDEPDVVTALGEHMKALTPEGFTADVAALAAESGHAIAVRPLPSPEAPRYRGEETSAHNWKARRFRAQIDRSWRLSSFTSLTSGREIEPRDYDAAGAHPEATLPAEGIAAFPAGKRAGSCLHAIFERIDFADPAAMRRCIDEQLAIFRYRPDDWTDVVASCLEGILAAPLPRGFSLRDVPRAAQLREVEFCFSAARLDAAELRAIADTETAGRFEFEPRRGLVKGFIDLVFEHGGRWFIVDWKSNQLGADARAYEPAALRVVMARHHYGLQYLIYTVALNRWLTRRPGYDYERDFGGVFYFFLRGIDPARPGSGVFHDRPSRAAIGALEATLSAR